MSDQLKFTKKLPGKEISDFVECFWMVENPTMFPIEVSVLPDANFDLLLSKSGSAPMEICLLGLGTTMDNGLIGANSKLFFINFKLLAAEYLLERSIATILNSAEILDSMYWDFAESDLLDFELLCEKSSQKILTLLPEEIDVRKKRLSDALYSSEGGLTIIELSDRAAWTSRQMNRYFQHYFGVTLKAYCSILRFRATFEQIYNGRLYPEQNFSDQAHFSREVKKLTGVNPRVLSQGKNDRFIQVSLFGKK
ncbi:AraC family transcriptional regulator [Sphingobacterium siyangense]|uniref:AraC family transcriptional regulator n=1 Tax=Sphingobacterium siyangense TaxID=459529 RepID=UPI002FDD8DF9